MSIPFQRCAAAIAAFTVAPLSAPAAPADAAPPARERIVDLAFRDGLRQRVLYDAPEHPRAAIVMLPGGSGEIGIRTDGDLSHDENFVVRTRADWVARGYAVLIPDAVHRANLRGLRSAPDYARLVDALAVYARDQARASVFLLGTSQGSIAAMNGAAHAEPGVIAGVVLTESVSVKGGSHETVFDADPEDVRVPALVVANRDDACAVAPPAMAQRIADALHNSADVKLITVRGGTARSQNACGSLSPHGYYGIETAVIDAICLWLRAHNG